MDEKQGNSDGVVPSHRVRMGKERTRVGLCGPGEKVEPKIILVRDGDVIQAIEVVCTCGQKIKLHCEY